MSNDEDTSLVRHRRSSLRSSRQLSQTLQPVSTRRVAAITCSTISCLSLLCKASASAFINSQSADYRVLLQHRRRAAELASGASLRFNGAVHQLSNTRRLRAWKPSTSMIMVASRWDNKGPPEDPFDERKMTAQGQHVINWCEHSLVNATNFKPRLLTVGTALSYNNNMTCLSFSFPDASCQLSPFVKRLGNKAAIDRIQPALVVDVSMPSIVVMPTLVVSSG